MATSCSLIVLIDPKKPTGVGESLSGDKAFFINITEHEEWQYVENDPSYKALSAEERQVVRKKFPAVLERYKIISARRLVSVSRIVICTRTTTENTKRN